MRPALSLCVLSWLLASCTRPVAATPPSPAEQTCPGTQQRCDGACVDTSNSALNCGRCGRTCAQNLTCVDSACACADGDLLCSTECVDPLSSNEHCGATEDCQGVYAGVHCRPDRPCVSGVCSCPPAVPILCGRTCIDPAISNNHCGARDDCMGTAAGVACPAGQACLSGACACTGAGFVACGKVCIDPQEDRDHCGAFGDCQGTRAGKVCRSEQSCSSGQCVAVDGTLRSLVVSPGKLTPEFAPDVFAYAYQSIGPESVLFVTATPGNPANGMTIDGSPFTPSVARQVQLGRGGNTLEIRVRAGSGADRVYRIALLHPVEISASGDGVFGSAVSLSGDTLAVVGKHSVFVYVRSNGIWNQQAALTPGLGPGGRLSVALSGDVLAVGDPDSSTGRGTVFVYERSGGLWTLKFSDASAGPSFGPNHLGMKVALDGDTLVASAPDERPGQMGSGAVYVYARADGRWSMQEPLRLCERATCFQGSGVALSGNDLVIGGGDGPADGMLLLLSRTGSGWSVDQKTLGPLTAAFPSSTGAASASIEGDRLVTGDPTQYDEGGLPTADPGRIHSFGRTGGMWAHEADFTDDAQLNGEGLGSALSLSGDTFAAGAGGKNRVYLYTHGASGWARSLEIDSLLDRPEARMGASVSLSGRTLAVGVPPAYLTSWHGEVLVYTVP